MRGLTGLAVFVGFILIISFMFGGVYNSLVVSEERVKESWAQVENVYQRRLDLVTNLVQTVKGYAAHERGTLDEVVQARSSISQMKLTPEVVNNPDLLAQYEKAQGTLSSALSRLLVVVERYPDLKASQNFLALQTQLETTNNQLAVERSRFNEASHAFNVKIHVFPNNVVAGICGIQPKVYFQPEEGVEPVPFQERSHGRVQAL